MSTFIKKFVMSINNNLDEWISDEELKLDAMMHDSDIPIGIIYYIKVNKDYKELLEILEIIKLNNNQPLKMIKAKMADNGSTNETQNISRFQDYKIEEEAKYKWVDSP